MLVRTTRITRRKGAAAVELACLLPVLMIFLLGMWEIGRLIDAVNILHAAAREGARQASAGSRIDTVTGQTTNVYALPQGGTNPPPDVKTAVLRYLSGEQCTTTNVSVSFANLTPPSSSSTFNPKSEPYMAERLDRMRIIVTIPYQDVRWSTSSMFVTPTTTLSATIEWYSMRDDPFNISYTVPYNQ